MLRLFFATWVGYWLLLAATPVDILYPDTATAFLVQALYVALVAVGYLAVLTVFGAGPLPTIEAGRIAHVRRIVYVSLLLSVVGFLALIYDKIAIQGIDYTHGLAAAREQWRRLGEERQGVSSIYSVMGYLFGSMYYVAFVAATSQFQRFRRRELALIFVVGFVLALANSAITGGRSGLLLLAAFMLLATFSRRGAGIGRIFSSWTSRIALSVAVLAGGGYTLFIFFARASASGLIPQEYVMRFLPYLGLELQSWYAASLGTGPLDMLMAIMALASGYIVHSFATVAAMATTVHDGGSIMFIHLWNILAKMGIGTPPDSNWFLGGRFPSLPGALWFQYGNVGLALGALGFGAAAALARIWATRSPHGLLPIGAYTGAGATLLLSPLLFAGDFLAFPFVVLSFALMAAYQAWLNLRGFSSTTEPETAGA